jgi:hypothetical protein
MRERTIRIALASGAEAEVAALVVALLLDGLWDCGEDGRAASGEEALGGGEDDRAEEVLFDEKGKVRCDRAGAGRRVEPVEESEVNVFQCEREDRAHFFAMVYSSGCGADGSVN